MKNNYHTNDLKSFDLKNNKLDKYKKLKRDKNEKRKRKSSDKA